MSTYRRNNWMPPRLLKFPSLWFFFLAKYAIFAERSVANRRPNVLFVEAWRFARLQWDRMNTQRFKAHLAVSNLPAPPRSRRWGSWLILPVETALARADSSPVMRTEIRSPLRILVYFGRARYYSHHVMTPRWMRGVCVSRRSACTAEGCKSRPENPFPPPAFL